MEEKQEALAKKKAAESGRSSARKISSKPKVNEQVKQELLQITETETNVNEIKKELDMNLNAAPAPPSKPKSVKDEDQVGTLLPESPIQIFKAKTQKPRKKHNLDPTKSKRMKLSSDHPKKIKALKKPKVEKKPKKIVTKGKSLDPEKSKDSNQKLE